MASESEKGLSHRDLIHFLCLILAVALSVPLGCSHLERLRIPFSHRVDPWVQQEELVRIDKNVYVRVPNPEAQTGETREPYRYIPVEEYLANPESYDTVVTSSPPPQEEEWRPVESDLASPPARQEPSSSGKMEVSVHFKKRLILVPFKDLADSAHKGLPDIVMRSLAARIRATSDQVILFDAGIMKKDRRGRKLGSEFFDSPEMARLAGQLYNIHAIVMGRINHVFTSSTVSTVKGKGKMTYAIVDISARLIDTASGKVRRTWEKSNRIFDSEGKGDFSEEKAQLKAIELITSELSQDIIEELKGLKWYTTIACVDGDRVYISAGKLSGVRVGDVFSVYPAAGLPNDPKGEVRIAGLFGIDASVADITKGRGFRVNDLVRPVFQ